MKTAVEKLEISLLGLISFDSEELRAKYKDRIKQAKEIEKQQIIDARVNGVCEGIDIGARPIGQPITEDISKNHENYYNETFKNK